MAGGRISSQKKRQRLKRQRERLADQPTEQEQAAVNPIDQPSDDQLGSGGDDDSKYGPTGYLPARTEVKLIERAVRNGWLKDEQTQRFETRTSENELALRVSSQPGEASAMELASLELIKCVQSPNRRLKMIAIRALAQMEQANQRDELESVRQRQRDEELSLKRAIVENQGGNVGETIPTGVVLIPRPCQDVEEWERMVAEAEANPVTGDEPLPWEA